MWFQDPSKDGKTLKQGNSKQENEKDERFSQYIHKQVNSLEILIFPNFKDVSYLIFVMMKFFLIFSDMTSSNWKWKIN